MVKVVQLSHLRESMSLFLGKVQIVLFVVNGCFEALQSGDFYIYLALSTSTFFMSEFSIGIICFMLDFAD